MSSARYIIDRIEDGEWAVLEMPDGTMLDVPTAWLPTDVSEGDVVHADLEAGAQSSTVTFTRDTDATERRRDNLQARRNKLSSSKPDGPISL
ncbi:MAG: DUF3006 domain-containing protein [Longimonas sp.]|uniref:DUF3006 domain-containing protein n=1 Tax=Longimonas sp. TaxID=2039626 RepID=UPI00335A2945